MLCFLSFFACSETISEVGFTKKQLTKDETLDFDFKESKLSSILLWGEQQKLEFNSEISNLTDYPFNFKINDATGIKLTGKKGNIKFNDTTDFVIWTVPSAICNGPIMYYSSQKYVQDDLVFANSMDEKQDLCIFFSNKDKGSDIYLKVDSKSAEVKPFFDVYGIRSDNTIGSLDKCKGASCTSTLNQPFFVRLANMTAKSSYSLDLTYNEKDNVPSSLCSLRFIAELNNGDEIISSIRTLSNDLVCEPKSPYYANVEHFYISIGILVIFAAVAIFLYITGMFRKISEKLCCCLSNQAGQPNIDGYAEELVAEKTEHFDIDENDAL